MTTGRLRSGLAVHLAYEPEDAVGTGRLRSFCGAGQGKDGDQARDRDLARVTARVNCLRCAEMAHLSYPLAYSKVSALADDLIDDAPGLHRFYGCDDLRYRGPDGHRHNLPGDRGPDIPFA